MSEPFEKLAVQLSQLFELEKSDLDFGIHRIIKARQKHIRVFLGLDEPPADDPGAPTLKKIVQREMGELNTVELERRIEATAEKIRTNYGQLAFNSGVLTAGPAQDSGDGQLWMTLKEELDSGEDKANAQLEAEIYSHLTEFFSRYYDEADFLSKRRIKAGDAPYAVPYSGEEVMLHWANKDQYYIKSSKDLKDYTFTLPEQFGGKRVQFKCERQDPVLNNNNAKREFHLEVDEEGIPQFETSKDADGKEALMIGFHFKIVDRTRTQPEAKAWIEHLFELLPGDEWRLALGHTPEGAKTNLLTRHLNNYTRKNEADFFIHKQLGKFLRGELDFYIKNEVMHLDDIDEKSTDYLSTRVRLIKALRTIAQHIIRFLAQLENFQKKLWLKKKYVTETQYCFTLDRVCALGKKGEVLLDTLLRHVDEKIRRYDGEMRSQHDEWIKLYAIDELEDYPKDGKLTAGFLKTHDKLMLDTVFYPPGFKWQLLGAMDDLEERLDGLLIHSENFQALNLLQDRYREKVKCIYIDPPYNTEKDRAVGKFLYKDGYPRSGWISFIDQGFDKMIPLINDRTPIFTSIDDNEKSTLTKLIEYRFGHKNILADMVILTGANQSGDGVKIQTNTENCLSFCLSKDTVEIRRVDKVAEDLRNLNDAPTPLHTREEMGYTIYYNPKTGEIIPVMDYDPARIEINSTEDVYTDDDKLISKGFFPIRPGFRNNLLHRWRWNIETFKDRLSEVVITENKHKFSAKFRQFGLNAPKNILKYSTGSAEMKRLFDDAAIFDYPKGVDFIARIIEIGLNPSGLALDYFAGSGTTAHAIIKLNREDNGSRKYILVEMGDHFDTVLKPRIQKFVYSADWEDGKPTAPDTGISHGFKYLRLESYEDALNNLDLGEDRAPDLLGLGDQVREDFLFSYLLDVETRGHLLNLDCFRDPWGCQLKIHNPHSGRSEARVVDLVETFHYLLGVNVRAIRVQGTKDKPDAFLTIEGENPVGEAILIIWRRVEANPDVNERLRIDWPVTNNEDLLAFAATKHGTARGLNPADTEFHAIYINGDHTLVDPNSKIHGIEEVFYERMFANTGNPED